MTITRIWQAGAELNFVNELEADPAATATLEMTTSSSKARSGTYSFRTSTVAKGRGKAFSSTTQVRGGVHINLGNDPNSNTGNRLKLFTVRGTYTIYAQFSPHLNELELVVNGSVVATCTRAASGLINADQWYHLGLTCKADASSGFVTLYIDGVVVLTWTGNTGSSLTALYFGEASTGSTWDVTHFDDFFVDDATGEGDAPVPSLSFLFGLVNAAGTAANLSRNTGATNWQAVDEATNDGDTTYVYGASAGLKDSYNTANVTVPTNYQVRAVIPIALARKTDAGTNSQWQLGTRASGGTEVLGSAQALTTGYSVIWERQTTEPGGANWDETKANAAEIVIQSAGSF